MRDGRRRGEWLVEEWKMEIWGGLEMGRGTLSFVEILFVFAVLFKGNADGVPFLRGWRDMKDVTIPRLFLHSTARITLLLVCDWKRVYLVSLFLFVVFKTDR